MPHKLTCGQVEKNNPKVSGFKSEWCPTPSRNPVRQVKMSVRIESEWHRFDQLAGV